MKASFTLWLPRLTNCFGRLANPDLHDMPRNLPFRVEMWDREHIRWVIAASASVAVGHAALDAAIANYPGQRFTLRNGHWSGKLQLPDPGQSGSGAELGRVTVRQG
jgi:hypothetical protein